MPSTSLQQTIAECNYYLSQKVSIIPVRDKPQTYNGREYTVKSAYPWARWQKEIATEAEMYHEIIERRETTGFGIVGGKVSGNLEIIDIDTKNWAGIDARLFSDIKSFFPDLFNKLRIHQSPSKGYHILYRISDHEAEGNKKLAWKEDSKEAALETRGEGGYVVASTAMGYRVVKDNPIPSISWVERCSLIAICEGYNQKVKIKSAPANTKQLEDYYDENPWDHYNNSPAAESVLTDNNWKLAGSSNNFIWFTRPDSRGGGVHASFNREKRVYYIFTSNTQFEPSRGYLPSTALSILSHSGDKKVTFKFLIDNGYGKVKPHREKTVAANAARKNLPLPGNLSDEAKLLSASIKAELHELHPFDIFWEYNDELKITINREKLSLVANYLGFKYHEGDIVQIRGQLVYKVKERDFQDSIKGYIKEPDNEEYFKIANCIEAFMESHGKYTMARLPILDTALILKDTRHTCYKFFTNGYLSIDKQNIVFLEYDTLDALIWADRVQPRNYNRFEGGLYVDYLSKAIVDYQASKPIIGYLAHEYKNSTIGYIIVLTEQCPDPKQGGGSGKNLFCNLLEYTTSYTSKPGSQTKFDEKFFQSWNGQRLFGISDVPKTFDYTFLKEPATGSFIWKKLFKDEVEVKVEDAPKFLVQTNYSFENVDGGMVRRIIPVEFTDFFTKAKGVDTYYNKHFTDDWTPEDWGGYDTFIAESIQAWMQQGLKLVATPLTATGWEKQFIQTYTQTAYDFIMQNWDDWKRLTFVSNEDWLEKLEEFYREGDIPQKFHVSKSKLYDAVATYCEKNKIFFTANDQKTVNGITVRGKSFLEFAPF